MSEALLDAFAARVAPRGARQPPAAGGPPPAEPPPVAAPGALPAWLQNRPPAPARRRPRRWSAQRQAVVVLCVALALVLLGMVALLAGNARPSPGTPGRASPTARVSAGAPATALPLGPTPDLGFFPAGGGGPPAATPPAAGPPEAADPPAPPVLAPAAQAESEGRYEDAIALYRPAAEATPGGPVGREARWHLAVSLFDAGQYDRSVEQFAVFARSYPTDTRSLRAAFWAGRAHLAAGRPSAALAEFTSFAPRGGPLRATALLLAADAAATLGDRARERTLLNAVLADPAARLDRIGAWTRLAALETAVGAPAQAAAWYAAVAGAAQMPSYRAEMLDQAGAALLAAGQTDAGEARLRDLVGRLPDQPAAYRALHRLLDSDPAVLSSGRVGYDLACRAAYAAGQYAEAVGYCESFRAAQQPGPGRADAAWYTARAFEAAGNPTLAASWYQGFTSVYTADARLPDALLRWGNLLLDGGDSAGALALYNQLTATYPQSPARAAAEDQAGLLLRRQGDFAQAAARWLAAATAPGADDTLRARALFWRGWSLQQQGHAADALASWRQGAAYHTFWGARCADHLQAGTVVPRDAGAAAAPDWATLRGLASAVPAPQAAAEHQLLAWAAGWSVPGHDVPAAGAVPARLAADPDYQRAVALAQVELWSEADPAFADLARGLEAAGDGTALAALGLEARRAGWPWLAYVAGGSLRLAATAAGQPPGVAGLPRAGQELVYPAAWPALVAGQAQAQGIDPWLLLALVRQESAYDPRARSSAAARGLTQVVPDTAAGIAETLHLPDFDVQQLYRPNVSLRFGAFYLDQTLAQFDRNILYALAGYNAGPGQVPAWAGGRIHDDPDLFVDNIDYPETRAYVEIVYANYATYRWLYAGR